MAIKVAACILTSLVTNVKAVKSFYPGCNGALKAEIAIPYSMYKHCCFGKLRFKVARLQNICISANIRVICSIFATMIRVFHTHS